MLEEICIRRRAGCKFELGSVLGHRWNIISTLSDCGAEASDGYSNRGIKIVQETSTGKLGVLKMLQPDITCPGHAIREICLLKNLTRQSDRGHANIVHLLDSDDGCQHPHDIPWIVTDLCDTGTLAQLVDNYAKQNMHLPEAFLWHIFESLAAAVLFCHTWGVVHQDISLHNVFLQSNTEVYTYPDTQLGDFGCAVDQHNFVQSTFENPFPGNPKFMPPEGYQGQKPCDIYQVGLVVLCLCMCESDTTESLPDFLNEMNACGREISPELKRLIVWCLSEEMEQRPSATMLAESIRNTVSARPINREPLVYESLATVEKQPGFCLDTTMEG
jgi:serine/threonine protein kinase